MTQVTVTFLQDIERLMRPSPPKSRAGARGSPAPSPDGVVVIGVAAFNSQSIIRPVNIPQVLAPGFVPTVLSKRNRNCRGQPFKYLYT